jgi:hypothetical protein
MKINVSEIILYRVVSYKNVQQAYLGLQPIEQRTASKIANPQKIYQFTTTSDKFDQPFYSLARM